MEGHKAAPTTSADAMCEEKNRNNHWVVDQIQELFHSCAHPHTGEKIGEYRQQNNEGQKDTLSRAVFAACAHRCGWGRRGKRDTDIQTDGRTDLRVSPEKGPVRAWRGKVQKG